jgi:hypothetical protein
MERILYSEEAYLHSTRSLTSISYMDLTISILKLIRKSRIISTLLIVGCIKRLSSINSSKTSRRAILMTSASRIMLRKRPAVSMN